MESLIIVEANMLPVPKGGAFMGYIESSSPDLSTPLENWPVSIFDPGSPISEIIQPGDLVLCQLLPGTCEGILHFYSPIRILKNASELFTLLQKSNQILMKSWDYTDFFDSVMNLMKLYLKVEKDGAYHLIPDLLKNLAAVNYTAREDFVFPLIKRELVPCLRSFFNLKKIKRYLAQLPFNAFKSLNSKDWLDALVPFLRDIAWWYQEYESTQDFCSVVCDAFFGELKSKSWNQFVDQCVENFERWAIRFDPFEFNFNATILIHPELAKVRVRLFQAYIQPLLSLSIFIRGRKYLRYSVGDLRKTFLGSKLLDDIHVPRGQKWVNTSTFNLIHAALRQINVTIKPQKYQRR